MAVNHTGDQNKIETAKMIVQTLANKESKSMEESNAYVQALAYLSGHLQDHSRIPMNEKVTA